MTAAATAVLRLPLTSRVLVVLLLGAQGGTGQLPVILLAAALAMVTAVALEAAAARPGPDPGEPEPAA
jgi:hypothetical protein